jgi:hypothetical protein
MPYDYDALFTKTTNPQALGNTGANASDYIDTGVGTDAFGAVLANFDIGMGKPVFANIQMAAAGASAGNTMTSTFELWGSATTSGFAKLVGSVAFTQAQLVVGFGTFIAIPPNAPRYLEIVNTVAGENATGGTFTAWLSGEPLPTGSGT